MCSIHANSAREAIVKMCTLPLLAGENVGHAFVVPTVAASVDLVVHTDTDHRGHRRVREIVGVPGRVEGSVVETVDIFASRGGRLVRADGFPPHHERFARLGIDLAALLQQPGDRPLGAAAGDGGTSGRHGAAAPPARSAAAPSPTPPEPSVPTRPACPSAARRAS
ncbi:MAG: hypothetical protein ACR2JQ_12720 [Mycobacteriales bacterium]